MAISRRDALLLAGGAALSATLAPGIAEAATGWRGRDQSLYPAGLSPWPVLQGPTDHQSATIILLLPTAAAFRPHVLDESGRDLPWRMVGRYDIPAIGLSTFEMMVSGLRPGRDYILYLLNENGGYFDRRLFRALDSGRNSFRYAAISCMNDLFRFDAVTMWEAVARENCDFVLIHGDTCYADQRQRAGSPFPQAERYAETRLALSWFRMERLVPTMAVWDDHDFGSNNGNRTFPLAGQMLELFRGFWGTAGNAAWQPGHGAGSRLEAFGQRFYLLDGRSFRDPEETPNGMHWGAAQLDWLSRDLQRSTRPAWIATGTQLFGTNLLRESVEADQPGDLDRLVSVVASQAAPAAFITGDVHFSEIRAVDPQLLGYATYEFTSSSIHSFPNPGLVHRDNIVAERRHNFMVFDVDQADGWQMRCRCILDHNVVSFDRSFSISRT